MLIDISAENACSDMIYLSMDDFRGAREAARVFDLRMKEDIEALLERGQLYGKQAVYQIGRAHV